MRFKALFALWGMFALFSLALAQDSKPQVDTAEVIRRGNDVSVVGEGPRSAPEEAYRLALAPPADDAHKWFITVVTMKNCAPCEALKADFRKASELSAFVSAADETKAWAHFNEYASEDTTQRFRLKDFRIASYPTVIVQPPRNGSWGDPRTVVFQQSGYNGKAAELAGKIRTALKAYSAKMAPLGYPKSGPKLAAKAAGSSPVSVSEEQDAPTGVGQVGQAGVDPPFPPFQPPLPTDPSMPATFPPAQEISPQGLSVIGTVIVAVLTLLGLGGFAGVVFAVWTLFRGILARAGKTPLISDEQFQQLKKEVLDALGQKTN
jgi:hypothetical protein